MQALADLDREIFTASARLQKIAKRLEYLCWGLAFVCACVVAGICFGFFRA